jgi:hypothetical protein
MEQEMNPLDNPMILQKLAAYAQSLGFKPEELQQLRHDPRLVQLALKAMAWDQLHKG